MHNPQNQMYKPMLQVMCNLQPLMTALEKKHQRRSQMSNQNFPQSESVSAQSEKQLELFEEYELIEQDGFITTHPDLKTLLTKKESPEAMEIKEGSITFEKND